MNIFWQLASCGYRCNSDIWIVLITTEPQSSHLWLLLTSSSVPLSLFSLYSWVHSGSKSGRPSDSRRSGNRPAGEQHAYSYWSLHDVTGNQFGRLSIKSLPIYFEYVKRKRRESRKEERGLIFILPSSIKSFFCLSWEDGKPQIYDISKAYTCYFPYQKMEPNWFSKPKHLF